MEVIRWLALYYTEMQVPEKAITLYQRASALRPDDAQWPLAIATCTQRIGNYHKAYQLLKNIHSRYPNNIECNHFASNYRAFVIFMISIVFSVKAYVR